MFKIDKSENFRISMTRGDSGTIRLKAKAAYFASGDIVKFTVMAWGKCTEVLFEKQMTVPSGASTTEFDINLAPADTKEFCTAVDCCCQKYWYEISVQNAAGTATNTLLGVDENGAKELYIYPESEVMDE